MNADSTMRSKCRGRLLCLLGAGLLLAPALSMAQQAAQPVASAPEQGATGLEEILAKHYEARGGLEKLRALDTWTATGRLSMQGFEIPLTTERKRPNKLRMELDVQGSQILQVYDGTMAWAINPMAGAPEPTAMPVGEAKTMAQQASFDGVLVDPQKQGLKLELVGKESLGEGEAYRILVTSRSGDTQTVFLDATTFLEKKRVVQGVVDGQEVEIEIAYDSFTDIDGVKMIAKQTNSSPVGPVEIFYDEYRLGASVDDEAFLMPGQEADPSLTLEQVLAKHLAARTRPEAEKIQTVKATGTLTLMGFQLPLEMSFARPSSTRLEADMQGMKMILAYDGETAWTLSPMQGIPSPEAMPEEAEMAIALFSDFLWGLLADHESKGYQLELAGIEKVERDDTYKVVVTTSAGDIRELYLGGEDFLERKVHLEAMFLGTHQVIDALLDDYRSSDGLMVPRSIELLSGGTPQAGLMLEKVEVNVEIDPTIFSLPQPAEAADGE